MKSTKLIGMSLVLIGTLVLSGCGSSSVRTDNSNNPNNSTKEMKEPTMPTPTKLDRANWEGVEELTDGLAIVAQGDNLSFKIRDNRIEGHNYQTQQIFIDSDNNANTGYSHNRLGNMGAEYLIEGNNLYSHRGNGWSWSFVSRVNTRVIDGNQLEVEFPRNLLQMANSIRAKAVLRARNWRVAAQTDMATFSFDQQDGNDGSDFEVYVPNDDYHALDIRITSPLITDGNFFNQVILIDIDNDSQTGYSTARFNYIGAEYLVEGDRLYSHRGGGWNWEFMRNIDRRIDDQTIRVNFSTDATINYHYRATAILVDRDWNVIQRFDTKESLDLWIPWWVVFPNPTPTP